MASATTGRAREHIRSRAQDRRIMAAGYHAAGGWGNGLGWDGWRKERRVGRRRDVPVGT